MAQDQTPKYIKLDADIKRLRELAKRQAEIANSPVMDALRENWKRHNDLKPAKPVVIIESELVRNEGIFESQIMCTERWARRQELNMLYNIYNHEHIKQDKVIDAKVRVNWDVGASFYGVDVPIERGTDAEGRQLGYHWEHPIKDIVNDFGMLKKREFSHSRENALEWKAHLEEVYDGILEVEVRGAFWWTMGLTSEAIKLIGLNNFMLYMYDEPEMMHKLMAHITEGNIEFAKYCERESLLSLNNDNDYIGSGTYGFTRELPQPDYKPGGKVRTEDMWVLIESQESVGISPEMYKEFIFPYHEQVAKLFGKTYYGCCEPVHDRWKYVRDMPNLRSVSISPWCDQRMMGRELGNKYVFSRKPNPSMISHEMWDEDAIRADLKETCLAARGCPLEIIMKDLHTINHEPERCTRWVELAHEAIEKYYE